MNILFDIPKTLYFNIRYFGFKGIFKLPVFISRKVKLLKIEGKITIETELKMGMIRIGYLEVGIFDKKYERTIWEVNGDIVFKGTANIGFGSRICVGKQGLVVFGKRFTITSSTSIVCFKKIVFGDDCLLSWDILLIDTDFHQIILTDNTLPNYENDIIIGNRNWIGCRTTILKGTVLLDNNVIGANSLLNKKYNCSNKLIAGNPAVQIKEIKGWKM
jgi:acetyltransferase-like isoleucine patch superfamily enzyme